MIDRYKIIAWLAVGGSSLVYQAKDVFLQKEVLIKECYPKVVKERFVFRRDEKGALQIPEGTHSLIANEMNNEKCLCIQRLEKEMEILSKISVDNPYTIFMEVIDSFETNNTKYVVYPFRNLIPMSQTQVLTILSALQKTRWVLKNLKPLFEAGYVHLDISVDNMINTGIGEEDPVITIIDFNSAHKTSDFINKVKPVLSQKSGFSAPELYANPVDYSKIDIRTDLYSVAASLFYWLHKQPISGMDMLDERRIYLTYINPIVKYESDELITKCNDILKKGLANDIEKRYKSIDEFEADVNYAIFIAQEWSNHYLTKSVYENTTRILFRESFIKDLCNDINNIRNNDDITRLLICGYGGIGKTSVLKCLFSKIKDEFRYVAYVNYRGNLIDSFNDVMPNYYRDGQNSQKRFELICNFLRENKRSKNTLFILDGADDITANELDILVNLEIHLVMTIRVWTEKNDYFIKRELNWLTPEQCIDIFYVYFEKDKDREYLETVKQIVNIAYYHTLSVELFAKVAKVYKPFNNLPKYLKELRIKGYKVTDYSVFTAYSLKKMPISKYLTKLFTMIKLTEEQKYILKNFAILSEIEIPYNEIETLLECTYSDLQILEDLGRISQGENGYYMHGITSEAVKLEDKIVYEDLEDIIYGMCDKYFETTSLKVYIGKIRTLETDEDFKRTHKHLDILERLLKALYNMDINLYIATGILLLETIVLHIFSLINPKRIHEWSILVKKSLETLYEIEKINESPDFSEENYECFQKTIKYYELIYSLGNTVNIGQVAILGNQIYFTNWYDREKLYTAKPGFSDMQKLCDDKTGYINVIGDRIYYSNISDGGKLYTIKIDGSSRQKLNNDKSRDINLVEDKIYYSNESDEWKLYTIKTDGSSRQKLNNDESRDINVVDDRIYYSNGSDRWKLYVINTDGSNRQKLNDDCSSYLNVVGNQIYYQNSSDMDKIYAIKTDGSSRIKICDDGAHSINVVNDRIYYCNYSDRGSIYSIRVNGSDRQKLNDTPSSYINIVGGVIYYTDLEYYDLCVIPIDF